MNFTRPTKIWNVLNACPVVKYMDADGVMVEDRPPQNKNRKLVLKPDGSTAWLVLSTHPTIMHQNSYGVQILAEKIEKGFLPLDECPTTRGYVKASHHKPSKECQGIDGRGKLDPLKPCPCLLRIQKKRRAVSLKATEKFKKAMMNDEQIMRDYMKLKLSQEVKELESAPVNVQKP